jgi:hypothetical protein
VEEAGELPIGGTEPLLQFGTKREQAGAEVDASGTHGGAGLQVLPNM